MSIIFLLFCFICLSFQVTWHEMEYKTCFKNPQLNIYGVFVSDKTPKALETVQVKALGSFDSSTKIVTGGHLEVDISFAGKVVKKFEYAVCEYTSPPCPLHADENVTMIIPQDVPVYVLPAKYQFTVKGYDQDGKEETCVTFDMVVV